jgi:hypothetical protein
LLDAVGTSHFCQQRSCLYRRDDTVAGSSDKRNNASPRKRER